jgi:hypothetical protein
VSPGEKPSADTINALIDAYNELSKITVGPGLILTRTTSGITISLVPLKPTVQQSST